MLKYKKVPDNDFHFQRSKYKGTDTNGIFAISYEISAGFFPPRNWTYVLRFDHPELDNKPIYRGNAPNLKEAKFRTEAMIQLVYKANTPGLAYLLKGVMLGFYREEDMEHLK